MTAAQNQGRFSLHIHVLDTTNGARLETYAIAGPPGSGINGAAAHLVHPADLVSYASVSTGTSRCS